MTIRLYARRESMPLAHVACDVTHDRCHSEDCDTAEGEGPKLDVFSRLIRLEGDLSVEQRAALLAIADRC